jgi:16S rRNA (guanine527-N7)-methyltransferase
MIDIILKYFPDLGPAQIEQFRNLKPVYEDWNAKINVISRKDIDSLYEKHVLHSLAIASFFKFLPATEIIDIGTGGGFPGIPLAIFFPEVRFHLVDSIAKKLKVVQAVVAATGLKNISTQHGRAEEIRNRKFDFAVTRAVAPLKELWTWSRPLLRSKSMHEQVNGLICLKGGDLAIEIQESMTRPWMTEISSIFTEEYFQQKYLLYIAQTQPKR